jgi:hypothetical protein
MNERQLIGKTNAYYRARKERIKFENPYKKMTISELIEYRKKLDSLLEKETKFAKELIKAQAEFNNYKKSNEIAKIIGKKYAI